MILLCVVGFVKDKEIDLVHTYEGSVETLMKNFRCADDYHVLLQLLQPDFLSPVICTHLATEALDRLIKIGFQKFKLLKH